MRIRGRGVTEKPTNTEAVPGNSGAGQQNTGWNTISVTFDTPLFSYIVCWRTRLPFYVLNKQCGWFDFLNKYFEIFDFVRVRARYKLRLVFRLSLVLSMVKFKFSAGSTFWPENHFTW